MFGFLPERPTKTIEKSKDQLQRELDLKVIHELGCKPFVAIHDGWKAAAYWKAEGKELTPVHAEQIHEGEKLGWTATDFLNDASVLDQYLVLDIPTADQCTNAEKGETAAVENVRKAKEALKSAQEKLAAARHARSSVTDRRVAARD